LHKVDYTDLLGKPFRLGARGPEYYDCWGLCLEMGKRAGIEYPADFTPEDTNEQDIAIRNRRDNDFVKLETPEPYCIVTFTVTPPFVDHCGIVLPGCKRFLHIMSNHSVAVQRLDHKILAKRIDGFYMLRKCN
jgi:cell wall-associated NlpC family hydrolase